MGGKVIESTKHAMSSDRLRHAAKLWASSSQSKLSSFTKVSVWKEGSRSPRFGLGLAGGPGAPLALARNYLTPDDVHDVARKLADSLGLPLETRVS